jgi:hypothetical protein
MNAAPQNGPVSPSVASASYDDDQTTCRHERRPIVRRRDYWIRGTKMTVFSCVCSDCGASLGKSHRLGC